MDLRVTSLFSALRTAWALLPTYPMASAQSAHTVRTRVVLSKKRPDTRAVTQLRPSVASGEITSADVLDDDARLPTSPFTPTLPARDSDPYVEMELSTEPREPLTLVDEPSARRLVKTVPRRLGVGSGPERAIEEDSDAQIAQLVETLNTAAVPEPSARDLKWIGVVVSPPLIGASLLIGTWLRPDFRVTTPVASIFERDDGVLVETEAKSRYFVKHSGDVYSVRVG